MDFIPTEDSGRQSTPPVRFPDKGKAPKNETDHDEYKDEECPMPPPDATHLPSSGLTDWESFESEIDNQCKYFGIEKIENVKENFFDTVQKSFKNFFDSLASCGSDKKSKYPTNVITGVGNALEMLSPTVGMSVMSVARMLVSSFETMCARLAANFDSTVDEVARTVFFGFCIVSAGIRSALPLLLELATEAKNAEVIAVVVVIAAVMACVYLATSAISTLLAAHHAILSSPTTKKIAANVLVERDGVSKNAPDFSKIAEVSLKKITQSLKAWKANVSSNFLALAKEIFQLIGSAISVVPALAKVAPVLAIPFVSIISGSINLVANALDTLQGVVDYVRLKGELDSLKQANSADKNNANSIERIENLERQLAVSKLRIAKGLLNMVLSAGSIVVGVAMIAFSTSVPILPALASVITAISLASVVTLGIVSLLARKMNMAGNARGGSVSVVDEEDCDSDTTVTTASDDSEIENDDDNPPTDSTSGS